MKKFIFLNILLTTALLSGCETEIEVPDGLPGSIEERPNLTPSPCDTVPESSEPESLSPGMVFGVCNTGGVTLYYRLLTSSTCEVVQGYDSITDKGVYRGRVEIPERVDCGGRPLTVVAIAERAFENSEITEVILPSTLTSIGAYAFQYSTQLRHLTIPGSVTRLETCVFRGCSGLQSVMLLNGVVVIGKMAFTKCTRLSDVRLPESLGVIDVGAFLGCAALREVVIPPNVGLINDYAFSRCGITSFTFPDRMTTLSEGVFQNCAELSTLHLPAQLSEVGCYALAGCAALERIVLPEAVRQIGTLAFAYCSRLHVVQVLSSTPPVCCEDSFDEQTTAGIPLTLEVPALSLDAYSEAPVWQRFEQIQIIQ